ncbi:NAC domain-containing protein 82 [Lactuca sativa]|uniref:NAC domain-containing protein n=1 Tax=Lactuca sativa TaxID=4236 RepID=A0A9R1X377_LACSA|nr:NAC domain-containing protein 82 [Lactuca sativa]XP_023757611.1 NAC domain-containing protein 82 [Lactuca sativa]KAJ0198985.1 hypothetical protein LSAT_V11C600303660 [Lactuca sativa]
MERSSLIPGFRFHPTDHELVMYYLKRKLLGKRIIVNAVAEVNIYEFSPWDLPDKSSLKSGDLEWFFFCPKSKKYSSGARSNRTTESGFWKATGKDRKVEYKGRVVARIKTLVFHLKTASDGQRTNWVMHEYNMEDQKLADEGVVQDMYVLCKIFEKEGAGPKNGAQYGAPFNEEEWDDDVASCSGPTNKPDDKQKGPLTLSLTEPGSSTITYSANETVIYKQKGPAATINNKTLPQSTCTLTEPAPSSSANANANDTPGNDDDVMLYEDLASIFGVPTGGLNSNNKDKGVEVKGVGPNEDEGIFGDLVNLVNLDDFVGAELNRFETDGSEYTMGMMMGADDLDVDLGRFCVD